jgi:L-asparaginase / beta-aspartyl-peptidase
MKNILVLTLMLILMTNCDRNSATSPEKDDPFGPITIVIHGGAGTIKRENLTPEKEQAYHEALQQALDSGYAVLENNGTSIEAVIAAIKVMEDSPLFNAGKGAVLTNEGKNELDASIMDGSNLMAGAVAGVTTIKNPITAAHAVMTKSKHVMMVGKGAEKFAEEQGLEIVDPAYFFDSIRYEQLLKIQEKEKVVNTNISDDPKDSVVKEEKFGTVGAVALDRYGNIAAGTSTGGMSNKRYGRVGDSPIIGAGTYAKNHTCGISATGWGEFFIRLSVAHDISSLMEYAGLPLEEAADVVIMKKLPALGGDGGVIGLDRKGNIIMTFNTSGMYRGYKKGNETKTLIFKEQL